LTRRKSASRKKKKATSKKAVKPQKKSLVLKGKNSKETAVKPVATRVSKKRGVKKTKAKKISHMTNSRKPRKQPKKKKPTKKQLRERALKGWKTRRKFERVNPSKKIQKIVTKKILPQSRHHVTTFELLDELSKYKMDGSLAKFPSLLRHLRDVEIIYNRLWATAEGEEYIAMTPDEVSQTYRFKQEAMLIADQYEVPVREVYTLFFSA
jgi:hypothetical protein